MVSLQHRTRVTSLEKLHLLYESAQPFSYTGREFDVESGLYFYRARYYDGQAGRFLSEDPLGFGFEVTNLNFDPSTNRFFVSQLLKVEGGVNPYLYVKANPLNDTDPTGERPSTSCLRALKECSACVEEGRECAEDHEDPVQCLERGENVGASVGGHQINECFRTNPNCKGCTIKLIRCGFTLPDRRPK